MKFTVKLVTALLIFFVTNDLSAQSVFKTIKQPDGTSFQAVERGEQSWYFLETPEGYIVRKWKDGYYYYHDINPQGEFIKKNAKVGIDEVKNIRKKPYEDKVFKKIMEKQVEDYNKGAKQNLQRYLKRQRKNLSRSKGMGKSNTGMMPTTSVSVGVILVEFDDIQHYTHPQNLPNGYSIPQFEEMLFSDNTYDSTSPDGESVNGSVRDYFEYQSHGILTITGDVINPDIGSGVPRWLNLGQSSIYDYVEIDGQDTIIHNIYTDYTFLIQDAINAAIDSSWSVDYDIISIVLAQGMYSNLGLWTGIGPPRYYFNNIRYDFDPSFDWDNWFGAYIVKERDCLEHRDVNDETFTHIGLHAHEMFHVLGWGIPNILGEGQSMYLHSWDNTSDFSLMNVGYRTGPLRKGAFPSDLDPPAKIMLEWAVPDTITSNMINETITYIEEDADTTETFDYYLFDRPVGGYIVIENRQQAGNNFYGPGWWLSNPEGGLLVWIWEGNYNRRLVLADNVHDMYISNPERTSGNDLGDVFPGEENVTLFAEKTTPSSDIYGYYSGFAMDNISSSGTNMTVDLYVNTNQLDSTITSNTTLTAANSPYNIFGNLTVNSGVTLTINSGVTIICGKGSEIIVKGDLVANGVTFEGGGSGYQFWEGIFVDVGGYANITNCTITDADNGIFAELADSVKIEHNTFDHCWEPIRLSVMGTSSTAHNNTITDCYYAGIELYRTSTKVDSNSIKGVGAGYGIATVSTPQPFYIDINDNYISKVNIGAYFTASSDANIYRGKIDTSSYACVVNHSTGDGSVGSDVSLSNLGTSGNGYHIVNDRSNYYLNAEGNIWYCRNGLPGPQFGGVGYIDWQGDYTIYQYKVARGPVNESLNNLLTQGKQLLIQGRMNDALTKYKQVLSNHSNSYDSRVALNAISHIMDKRKDRIQDNINYFQSLLNINALKDSNDLLNKIIARHLLFWLERNKDNVLAANLYDKLFSEISDPAEKADLLYGKARLYIRNNQPDDAVPLLNQVAVMDGYIGDMAARELKDLGEPIPAKNNIMMDSTSETSVIDEEGDLLLYNYPNPFNPETKIRFNLKDAGRVKIAVYNILGQRVKTLIDSEIAAGTHSVTWDGTNMSGIKVAGGVYIYRMEAAGQVFSKKMILLK